MKIRGRGGHAAFPDETVDPVLTAAVAITSLQQIVSRNSPSLESVVVSVTRIAGRTADNVIPNEVELRGTAHTFKPHVRERTIAAMTRILDGVTATHGASNEFEYITGYDPVINEPALAALVREAAGAERIIDMEPLMAGDDFSAYLRVAPGCFSFVGAGESSAFPHHHPQFKIDERALPIGIETLTETALRLLVQSSPSTPEQVRLPISGPVLVFASVARRQAQRPARATVSALRSARCTSLVNRGEVGVAA